MEELFLSLLNRSLAAGWLILAVILLRLVLKKAPKAVHCLLWLLVGVRLVCPFSIESGLSLIPSAEVIQSSASSGTFQVSTGLSAVNSVVNPYLADHPSEGVALPAGSQVSVTQICAGLWLAGAAALLLYSLFSYLRLRRRVAAAVRLRDDIWQSDQIASPFLLGLFRPRIYLPFDIDPSSLSYVEAHERAHIRRRDHWWKPLGFLLLTVYWFNPLVWAAYVLLCRDIELACDEQVVRRLGADCKRPYSEALLQCGVSRRSIAACPLAFGEVGIKQRVKNVLNYKRPAFWVILVSLIVCAAAAVCFLTDPVELCRDLRPGDQGFEGHALYGVADCSDPYSALLAAIQGAEPLSVNSQADQDGVLLSTFASYSPDLLDGFTIPDLSQVHDFFTITTGGRTVIDISYQTGDGTDVVAEYYQGGGFYKFTAGRRALFQKFRQETAYWYLTEDQMVITSLFSDAQPAVWDDQETLKAMQEVIQSLTYQELGTDEELCLPLELRLTCSSETVTLTVDQNGLGTISGAEGLVSFSDPGLYSYLWLLYSQATGCTVYTGGALLCQSGALSYLPVDAGDCVSVVEDGGTLTICGRDGGTVFIGSRESTRTYSRRRFLALLEAMPLAEPEKLADMVPQEVKTVTARVYCQTGGSDQVTIWELAADSGETRLWLGFGGLDGETPLLLFELLDLSQVFPFGAQGLLWTYSPLRSTLLPVRFDGSFVSVEVWTDSGAISLLSGGASYSSGVETGSSILTLSPGDTVYWAPAVEGEIPASACLSFLFRLADDTEIQDRMELRPVSDQVSLYGSQSCGLSIDWLGSASSRFHLCSLTADAEDGGCVVSVSHKAAPLSGPTAETIQGQGVPAGAEDAAAP